MDQRFAFIGHRIAVIVKSRPGGDTGRFSTARREQLGKDDSAVKRQPSVDDRGTALIGVTDNIEQGDLATGGCQRLQLEDRGGEFVDYRVLRVDRGGFGLEAEHDVLDPLLRHAESHGHRVDHFQPLGIDRLDTGDRRPAPLKRVEPIDICPPRQDQYRPFDAK